MISELGVFFEGRLVGNLLRQSGNRIGMIYSESWRKAFPIGQSFAISRSLPIIDEVVDATAYVAGLLPDSPHHREVLIRELDILDDPSDFALISKMGRDNAGALSILPISDGLRQEEPQVDWLTPSQLAEHIRSLPRRPLLVDDEHGIMLSLAGVNDKAAVVVKNNRVGLPRNGYPSTHIIKVDIPGLEDSIKTEHFCLMLARSAKIRAPAAALHTVEDQDFMLMARYDRALDKSGRTVRLHQEDFCQALGFMPSQKYQRHGGPGWSDAFALMHACSNPASARLSLLENAVFQFLIGNPDAHAKNYSLLFTGRSGALQLAPIYDLNNAAAFRHKFKKTKPLMAMSIGSQINRDLVTGEDFDEFAQQCGFSRKVVRETLVRLSERILRAMPAALAASRDCEAVRTAAADIRGRCELWKTLMITPERQDLIMAP